MSEYRVTIEATVQAKNFASAQRKCDYIKQRVEKIADAAEVRLKGRGEKG